MRRHGSVLPIGMLEAVDDVKKTLLVRRDVLFNGVEKPQTGCEIEEMFLSPVAGEVLRYFVAGLVAARVAMLRLPLAE